MAGTRIVSSTVSTDNLRSWGSDCQGLLQVVSPQEGRPMLLLWAALGWAPRTKTWQPGNHPQSPTPGQAPGQVPGNPGPRQDHLDAWHFFPLRLCEPLFVCNDGKNKAVVTNNENEFSPKGVWKFNHSGGTQSRAATPRQQNQPIDSLSN